MRNANTSGTADYTQLYGFNTDVGIAGDWNGDGVDTVGHYRPSNGYFILSDQLSEVFTGLPPTTNYNFTFGGVGDRPLVGDWDGDGKESIGTYRPSNRTFYMRNALSSGAANATITFGNTGDLPITGDWNCD